ncbi:heavy-metal-associated domain-containing protein [Nocardia brasiliensis]|uniref:heavy-metal-associated domain-containing protein n=1 Tax=Nocardia brasiliensis TaxID=37326 RepID=UPI003D91937A
MGEIVYKVTGMSCAHCVNAVTKALTEVDGVGDVRVDLDSGTVTVTEQAPVSLSSVGAALAAAGYELAQA